MDDSTRRLFLAKARYNRWSTEDLLRSVKNRKIQLDRDFAELVGHEGDEEGFDLFIAEMPTWISNGSQTVVGLQSQGSGWVIADIQENYSKSRVRKMMKDRPQHVACNKTTKFHGFLVDILTNADQNLTFRFLDLIPELRNKVYDKLLAIKLTEPHKVLGTRYDSDIKFTCRQIYDETRGILHRGYSPQIRLDGHAVFNRRDIRLDGHILSDSTESVALVRPPYRAVALNVRKWPEILLELEAVTIVLDIEGICWVTKSNVSHSIEYPKLLSLWEDLALSLCCFLQSSTRLKQVTIETCGHIDGLSRHPPVKSVSHAFSRLVAKFDCTFTHCDGWKGWNGIAEGLKSHAITHREIYRVNTLFFAQTLQQQVLSLSDVLDLLSSENKTRYWEVRSIMTRLHTDVDYDGPEKEVNLQKTLYLVGNKLDKIVLEDQDLGSDDGRIKKFVEADGRRRAFLKSIEAV